MNEETKELSATERVVIQVVASSHHLINDVPRPYSLDFFAAISGLGKKQVYSALRNLDLLDVLTEDPDQAIQRATALLPRALEIIRI